ncbi:MAG: UDP-N-acetylmuramoyl-tripeptide--D-alanyl-D-alanine ligase [Armatimonadetes bacterium]|nr:UDP-N-acetylmuramoyl-tripeptide--D-alanyl-D-alanine ligase [Armatimonadota bacterium]MDW8122064.1 UDP-N-acetylmuramoyl-tripeptide--D-alanyl-D-alanine ligase [Armatimonadota bacterium]
MEPILLTLIAQWVGAQVRGDPKAITITKIVTDSRQATPGSLFVALKGEKGDGHSYVTDAEHRGAAALLVSRPVPAQKPLLIVPDTLRALGDLAHCYLKAWRQKPSLERPRTVIAVTGSSGKTTTKDLIATVVATAGPVVASPESYNNEIGVPLTIFNLTEEHWAVVLEFATRKRGDIAYLSQMAPPDIAVITNIGRAHIGFLGSQEQIAEEKSDILLRFQTDETKQASPPIAVLPADDPFLSRLAAKAAGTIVTFGYSEKADVRGIRWKVTWDGTEVEALINGRVLTVHLPALGSHNALNALAALAVASLLNLDLEVIIGALKRAPLPKMRLQKLWCAPPGCWVLNDAYNANPDSVGAALRTLKELPAQRKVAILGTMLELGPFHEAGHQEVGKKAAQIVDLLMVIGQDAYPIVEGALSEGMGSDQVIFYPSIEQAVGDWRQHLMEGDLVLIKGSRALKMERLLSEFLPGQ